MSFLIAFATTILLIFALRPVAKEIGLVDAPGGRKRHGVHVPLVGGLAMSIAIGLASSMTAQPEFLLQVMLGIYLLVFVGVIDDRYELPPNLRLITQAVAAALVVFGAGFQVASLGEAFFVPISLGPLAPAFSLLFIMVLINAFNVIDGIDGLAGGLALISLGALALVGIGTDIFALALIACGALMGFLLFNLPLGFNHRVRSFMGDAGSTFLGFVIAALGIRLSQNPVVDFPPVVGLWIVAVPIYDLFSAALRRTLAGRSPFSPDHEHLHYSLAVQGLGHRATLIFILLCAVLLAAIGLVGHYFGLHDSLLLIGWFCGMAVYYQAMRRAGLIVRTIQALRALPRDRVIRPR